MVQMRLMKEAFVDCMNTFIVKAPDDCEFKRPFFFTHVLLFQRA